MKTFFIVTGILICAAVWLAWFLKRYEISERQKLIILCFCKNYLANAYPNCQHDKSLTLHSCEYMKAGVIAVVINIYGNDNVKHQVYMKLQVIDLESKNISVQDIDDNNIAKYRSDFTLDC